MSDAKRDLRAAMRRIRAAVLDRDARTQRLWDAVVGSLPSSRFNGLNVLAFVGVASEPNTESLLQMLGRLGACLLYTSDAADE